MSARKKALHQLVAKQEALRQLTLMQSESMVGREAYDALRAFIDKSPKRALKVLQRVRYKDRPSSL